MVLEPRVDKPAAMGPSRNTAVSRFDARTDFVKLRASDSCQPCATYTWITIHVRVEGLQRVRCGLDVVSRLMVDPFAAMKNSYWPDTQTGEILTSRELCLQGLTETR